MWIFLELNLKVAQNLDTYGKLILMSKLHFILQIMFSLYLLNKIYVWSMHDVKHSKFKANLQSFYKFLKKDLIKVMFSFFPLHSMVGYIVFFSSVLKSFCKLMYSILLHIKYIRCRRKTFDAHGTLGLCPFISNLI
jgi:hypothetical protein